MSRVIVITGSAHGIGRAIKELYEKKGDIVCGMDLTEGEYFQGDASMEKDLRAFAKKVIADYGKVSVLVNNVPPLFQGIDTAGFTTFLKAMAQGPASAYYLSKLFRKHFEKGGSIINISSTRDSQSMPQSETYAAAKGAIHSLTQAMAISLGPDIRVNSISPGWIDTNQSTFSKADEMQQPVGRVGVPEDIAHLVHFLASDKAGFITGENIRVDGGMSRLMIYHEEHGWTYNPDQPE